MQLPSPLHSWKVSPQEALNIQRILGGQVQTSRPDGEIRFVAGLAAAFSPDGKICIGGVVLWDMQKEKVIEEHYATHEVYFPETPELLTFCEAPAFLAALQKLKMTPDILMFDGQGVAHPRRMGIASHMGVFTGMAAIGCSQIREFGENSEPALERGSKTNLMYNEHLVGIVLRTKNKVKPLYISIGHKIDLASAEEIVLRCTSKYRLPEPTRLADRLVAKAKQEIFMILKKKK